MIPPAAAGGVTTLSQPSGETATSTAQTITGPSGIQAGDLLVLLDRATNVIGTPATVVPSGFTSIVNTTSANVRQIASYKIADGTEASASLTGMNGDVINAKALYVFRGNVAISAVNVSTPNSEATDGNPASQSVTASGGTPPLIVLGCYGSSGAVDPRTFSTTKDGEINPSTALYLAYKIYNVSPADTSIDMDDEGVNNILQSFYIECS